LARERVGDAGDVAVLVVVVGVVEDGGGAEQVAAALGQLTGVPVQDGLIVATISRSGKK
jgi:hypothetical protein